MKTTPFIKFNDVEEFPGWEKMPSLIKNLIDKYEVKSVLEIGAGANPTLGASEINFRKLNYTISDVDTGEIEKANHIYNKIILDLCAKDCTYSGAFDMIFSRMAAEHFYSGKIFHKNLYKILKPGGISVHCFSTLYALPFLINKLIPQIVSKYLLKILAQRDEFQHGKFKAYYRWCRGPSKKMICNFENLGYEIINYTGYFGHYYYVNKFPILNRLEKKKRKFLLKHPTAHLTSYALIILKKKD